MSGSNSLDVFKAQINEALKVYESSVRAWSARRQVYSDLLAQWADFDQLRKNPVDLVRLEFIDNEIAKQRQKLHECQESLKKFGNLEVQMRNLANATPKPTAAEQALASDEVLMEIREELDENDNIISATVSPHDQKSALFSGLYEGLGTRSGSDDDKFGKPRSSDIKSTRGELTSETSVRAYSESTKIRKEKEIETVIPSGARGDGELTAGLGIEPHQVEGLFNVTETPDGEMEITDDSQGFSIGIIPQDLPEMTHIVDEMNRDSNEDEDGDESEDEFGRSKHCGLLPLPGKLSRPSSSQDTRDHLIEHNRRHSADLETVPITSARRQKKLLFADELVQGPTTGNKNRLPRSVLKKESAYPITDGFESESPPVTPIIAEPKQSRFRLERSSRDTKIAQRHALPSQKYQKKIDEAVAALVVERNQTQEYNNNNNTQEEKPIEFSMSHGAKSIEEHHQLFPNKINLASTDLDPTEGTVKAEMNIPRLSEAQMEVIRKKRELLGKKHRRRKSADPHYPVRSGSWDDSQPLPKPHRRPSTGEEELLAETQKASRLTRAREILKAQDDIAWANSPISPDDVRNDQPEVNISPLSQAGLDIREESKHTSSEQSSGDTVGPSGYPHQLASAAIDSGRSDRNLSPNGMRVVSPRARKTPTPERRSSTNIPSPLSQEVQPHSTTQQVQFTADVIKKLEPLAENDVESQAASRDEKGRRKPPRRPTRQSSVDPQIISPTPGSPPPENRHPGPLQTEADGAITHHMVRATSKSPPPHIAIHDLISDTPENIRQAVKNEALSPTPQYAFGMASNEAEINPLDGAKQLISNGRDHNGTESVMYALNRMNEHETSTENDKNQAALGDDDIDNDMHRKEIVQEYHKLRARMIGLHGGYVKEAEAEFVPLDDDDPSPGQRVSRFKAAKLKERNVESQ